MNSNPVTSYGIIAYYNTKTVAKFLLVQRKFSYSYINIVRGKWSASTLNLLVDFLTVNERKWLIEKSFTEQWNNLWTYSRNNQYFMREKNLAELRFSKVRPLLQDIFKEECNCKCKCKCKCKWVTTEWGLPKGKKNQNEADRDAALREFSEETGIDASNLTLDDGDPVFEDYIGDDGINYRHIYFLAKINTAGMGYVDSARLAQKAEIAKIAYFDYYQLEKILRDYQISKLTLLKMIHERVSKK